VEAPYGSDLTLHVVEHIQRIEIAAIGEKVLRIGHLGGSVVAGLWEAAQELPEQVDWAVPESVR
jgi:hypothetical protein